MKKMMIFARLMLHICLLYAAVNPFTEVLAQSGGALFIPGPVMNRTRIEPFMATLNDGRVVTFGGREYNFISCSYADIYDPSSNTFTEMAMNYPHDNAYALKLADGRYFIIGGAHDLGVAPGYATTEMFYPATNTFVPSGSMNYARMWADAAQLTNGNVLIAGGWYNTPGATYGEVYDTAAHTFVQTNAMIQPRANMVILPTDDGGAVIFGGFPSYGGNDYTSVEYYNPTDNSFHSLSSEILPDDPGWLVSGTPFHRQPWSDIRMTNGKYLIFGTNSVSGQYGLLTFDPATKSFDKITLSSPLMNALTNGGFYGFVLDKAHDLAYLLGVDSGYDPLRVSLVAVNLNTGFVYHPNTTFTMGTSEYLYPTMAFIPGSGKIMLEGISSSSSDYFHATNKTYLLTPQPALGVNELQTGSVGINCYPNPANDILQIRASSGFTGDVRIDIYDMIGRLVISRNLSGTQVEPSIVVSNLSQGLYVCQVINNGNTTRIKFLKN